MKNVSAYVFSKSIYDDRDSLTIVPGDTITIAIGLEPGKTIQDTVDNQTGMLKAICKATQVLAALPEEFYTPEYLEGLNLLRDNVGYIYPYISKVHFEDFATYSSSVYFDPTLKVRELSYGDNITLPYEDYFEYSKPYTEDTEETKKQTM